MVKPHLLNCDVAVDPAKVFGVFANAFRVTETDDGRCLLEFLVYAATEDRSTVVQRVSVPKSFLPLIRDRIAACVPDSDPSAQGGESGG
jgi:hypothetical protein